MKVALLDVNVLLAMAWPNHQHHAQAHAWFARESKHGWATLAAVQLAFVRLSSNPAYTPDAVRPADAAGLLKQWIAHPAHRTWASPTAADSSIFERALGHQQVNDAYLVAAARMAKGRLVTFDRRLLAHDPAGTLVSVIAPEEGD